MSKPFRAKKKRKRKKSVPLWCAGGPRVGNRSLGGAPGLKPIPSVVEKSAATDFRKSGRAEERNGHTKSGSGRSKLIIFFLCVCVCV